MKPKNKFNKKYLFWIIPVLIGLIIFASIQSSFSDNVVAYFPMTDTDGNMSDIENGVSYSVSAIQDGESFYVSGSNKVDISDVIEKSEFGSVGFWVKNSGDPDAVRMLFSLGSSSNQLEFRYTSSGFSVLDRIDGWHGMCVASGVKLSTDNEWRNYLVVADGENWRVFVDGVEYATSNSGGSPADYGAWLGGYNEETVGMLIGESYGEQYPFNGYIKDVVIFNKDLTEIEVQQYFDIYNESGGYPFLNSYVVNTDCTVGGIVEGNGTYYENETVEIEAIADEGYEFIGWDAPFENESKIIIFNVIEDVDFFANFELEETQSSGGGSSGGASSYTITVIEPTEESELSQVLQESWWVRLWIVIKNFFINIWNWIIFWD